MELLKSPHAFPVAIICMYAATCVRYAFARDWGRCLYWVCAAGITVSATFLMGGRE